MKKLIYSFKLFYLLKKEIRPKKNRGGGIKDNRCIEKNIAISGCSVTNDIKLVLKSVPSLTLAGDKKC